MRCDHLSMPPSIKALVSFRGLPGIYPWCQQVHLSIRKPDFSVCVGLSWISHLNYCLGKAEFKEKAKLEPHKIPTFQVLKGENGHQHHWAEELCILAWHWNDFWLYQKAFFGTATSWVRSYLILKEEIIVKGSSTQ